MNEKDREDLVKYRIDKARETFNKVSLHIENKLWNTAVNRLCFACYYAVTALLIKNEIKTTTHAGARQMFGLHYVKTGIVDKKLGKFYSDIFDMRQTGDYEDYIDFTKKDVDDLLIPANELISNIEKLLRV
ncbi:MAG: HEPN domain-containing protein [Flavobacteriales bacterium]